MMNGDINNWIRIENNKLCETAHSLQHTLSISYEGLAALSYKGIFSIN